MELQHGHVTRVRGGIVAALVLAIAGSVSASSPAAAASAFWSGNYSRSFFSSTYEPGDTLTNEPRSFSPQTFMYIQSPGWPSRIELDTSIPTVHLATYPPVTPTVTTPGRATYKWEGAGSFFSAYVQDTRLVSIAPGVTMTRDLIGGRAIAPHAIVDRELHVDIHVVDPAAFVSATIVFQASFLPPGSIAPPVVASNISCPTGAPNPGSPEIMNWFGLPATAGAEAHLTCTMRLENTSDFPARYMPDVSLYVTRSFSNGASVLTQALEVDDPALGHVTYAVTPTDGVAAEGTLFRSDNLGVSLAGENISDRPMPWSAQYTENLSFFSQDNAVPDEVRPFERGWQFSIGSPGWPSSIRVDTPLNTDGWFVAPEVEPLRSPTNTMYRWDGTGYFGAFLSSLGFNPETRVSSPASLGVSVAREAVGGTRMEAGATVEKSYVVRLVGTTDTTADVSVFISSGTSGTPNPITVTNQRCDDARVLGGLPGGFAWTLALARGVEVELNCFATLTNTASRPANYMPVVFVTRTTSTVQPAQSGNVLTFNSPPLGVVTFEVHPPAGTEAEATLTHSVEKTLFLGPLNRAGDVTELTYVGATEGYHGESVTLAAGLDFASGAFPVQSRPVRFNVDGASYTATTGTDGIARVELPAGLGSVGAHTVTVTFDGDSFFMEASTTATINVLRRPTTLTYTGDANATFGFAQLSARLSDTRSGAALGGKTVSFAIDGVVAGTGTTDATGRAVLISPPASRLGPGEHTIGLSFLDDSTHAASTATGRITIANSVGKVNGDLRTTNGARVTLNVKAESSIIGALDLTTGTRTLSVRSWIGFGISPDRQTAVIYGLTAAGEDVVAELTDAGDPGRNDRAIVRLNGASLTADGALAEGNVQIHK